MRTHENRTNLIEKRFVHTTAARKRSPAKEVDGDHRRRNKREEKSKKRRLRLFYEKDVLNAKALGVSNWKKEPSSASNDMLGQWPSI